MQLKMFAGRKLLIATKHKKEQVIAPLFEKALGVHCFTTDKFDTDSLGTFTGEIERLSDPYTTAKQKCLLALHHNDYDLVLASEGSFGAHPSLFFAAADDECLLLLDTKNKIEIAERHISTATNFNGTTVSTEKELFDFAEAALFPTHALVIRKSRDSSEGILKGITEPAVLIDAFYKTITQYGSAFVETDMRAMYNPSRMKVIAECAHKLLEKISSLCPNCSWPGFAVVDVIRGLPCELCGAATKSTLRYLLVCKNCNYQQNREFPHGKKTEEAMYCDFCNP